MPEPLKTDWKPGDQFTPGNANAHAAAINYSLTEAEFASNAATVSESASLSAQASAQQAATAAVAAKASATKAATEISQAVGGYVAELPFSFDSEGYPTIGGVRTDGDPLDFLPGGTWDGTAGIPSAVNELVDNTVFGSDIDRTGTVDSSAGLAQWIHAAITTWGFLQIPAGEYNLQNWVAPTVAGSDVTIVANGRVKINLLGGDANFIKVTGGSLTVRRLELDGFTRLAAFDDNNTDVIDTVLIDEVKFTNSTTGGLISYFPNTDGVLINQLEVRNSEIGNCRQGIHYRGRFRRAVASFNNIHDTQHYSIRFGKDWAGAIWSGNCVVINNEITNQYNPVTGSGHEANMIAVFCDNGTVCNNTLDGLTNASAQDCEGIYLKARQFTVNANNLRDVGMDEGAIIVKGHPGETGSYTGALDTGVVSNNTIRFRNQRNYSIGINVLRGNVKVIGNTITGAGVNGIRVSWRGSYENITIDDNTITWMNSAGVQSGGHPLAAILLFGYGRNISVTNNTITGAYTYGIRLENNISTSVRYPESPWVPIGEDITIENNTIVGTNLANSRGISVGMDASAPLLQRLRIGPNTISGFVATGAWDIYIVGRPGCNGWHLDGRGANTVMVETWPTTMYVRGFSWSGTDAMSSSATSKTTAHGIPTSIGAKLSKQDVTVTPNAAWGSATKFWVSAVNQGSIAVAVDIAPGSGGFQFAAKVAIDRLVTT